MKWVKGKYTITDDSSLAEIDFVHQSLNTTYWAENRSKEIVERSLENSVLLSLFHKDEQVGFTRIVGDHCTFAWVCDVYIHPDYRGKGLGVWLMETTANHPAMDVSLQILATKDAHGLYEKFGFKRREMMYRKGE